MNLEGKIIGNRYEVLEQIGVGGMATVYKAKCNVLNRYVAIKVLREEFTTDEEFIKRFNSEAQSASSLTHPNIVSIYDVGHEDNLYYIVMELIKGKTLKEIIDQDGVLPWKWSVNIAIQIASALEAAHRNNIIHRDIKPHNIIITEEGIAKVTDFGIAKAVSNSTITAFGTTIGSVHYFSPEHAKGGYTDAKSDLYSLGVVIYEMVTGRVPFDADTPVSIALKHMQEKPVEPIKLNPSIPYALNKLIMKALQKEANLRYASATEMLKDLSMVLKDPDGDFINITNVDNGKTQVVPTITDDMVKENKEDNKRKKKKSKLAQFFEKHPKAKGPIIALILLVVFGISLGITYLAIDLSRPDNVSLPNFVNMTKEQAEQEAEKYKLKLEVSSEEYNPDVEAGKIISQDPPFIENYDYKVLENSTVKVVISKGTEVTKVPKIAGMTYDEAVAELEKAKLKVEKIEETSEKIEEGVVIKQDPKEDEEVNAGETVKVYVSIGTGIKQVLVPSVISKDEETAKSDLNKAGLKPVVEYTEDKTKSNGVVIKQSIDSGKEVDEGTSITITVNKIAEIKKGNININLKSLLNYTKPEPSVNEIEETAPNVEVKVIVDDDTVYKEEQRKDTTKITVPVSGTGVITVKVYVDDILKNTSTMDLNTTTNLTIE